MADDDPEREREREIDITLVQGDNHMWHPNDCTLGLAIRLQQLQLYKSTREPTELNVLLTERTTLQE